MNGPGFTAEQHSRFLDPPDVPDLSPEEIEDLEIEAENDAYDRWKERDL